MHLRTFVPSTALAALVASTAGLAADPVRDFYAGPGNQMRIIVRTTAGADYDVLSRTIARHIVKHIPGKPTMVAVNMPGAGGLQAANFMGEVAPRDGTHLSIVGQGLFMDQALGLSPQLKVDLRQLIWIANPVSSNSVLVTWHTSPTQSLEVAKRRETTVGSTGAGSVSMQYPAFYNNVLGTRFKIVFGYPGGTQIDLAMERGEVEGRGSNTWHGYKSTKPQYVEKKLITPLIQIGLKREPGLDAPLLLELPVAPENRPLVELMSRGVALGRPLATTPGVPTERVAALRKAYADMLQDAEFVAETQRQKMEINPYTGDDVGRLVTDLVSVSQDVRERTKRAIVPDSGDAREMKVEPAKSK